MGRSARHGPAQRSVAGVEEQIVIGRRSDDRRTVGGHRTQAAPETRIAVIRGAGKERANAVFERGLSFRRQAPVEASKLRSEEHTSELQSLMRSSYAVFCLKQKTKKSNN